MRRVKPLDQHQVGVNFQSHAQHQLWISSWHISWIPQNNARLKLSCKVGESNCNPYWHITLATSHGRNYVLNTLMPRQNGRHFADDIFKCIFLNENVWISIKISLKFVPKGPINNIPALVQIMAWRRPGDKPLSEAMMVNLPTHICVFRPQWVNEHQGSTLRIVRLSNPTWFTHWTSSISIQVVQFLILICEEIWVETNEIAFRTTCQKVNVDPCQHLDFSKHDPYAIPSVMILCKS